jgi:ABC-type transport system involved in multi-copper enzyme maturation permease subunit
MTFLPVMDRELRVAARKRSTFWLRVIAALVAIVIGALLMMLSWIGAFPSPTLGRMLFSTLTWMALAVALAAGPFLTADCLSEEKREGTLGFLFLTSLRGYDVAGGKLLAASWRAAFALIAVIPILALALVLGGVTGSQFWKTALALLNALFCSLTAGLMISAVSRDAQKALGGTVVVLLLVVLVGPGVESGLRLHSGRPLVLFSLASPLYAFAKAQAWGRTPFWLALAVSHAVGWVMLALACLAVPR